MKFQSLIITRNMQVRTPKLGKGLFTSLNMYIPSFFTTLKLKGQSRRRTGRSANHPIDIFVSVKQGLIHALELQATMLQPDGDTSVHPEEIIPFEVT